VNRVVAVVATSAAVIVGLAVGCTDLNTAPDAPFSMEILELPSPSIVVGDTLRDIDGVAAPLTAVVYNVEGEPIPGATVTFFAVDTTGELRIDPTTSHVTSTGARRGSTRIFATIGSLQTPPETLTIVPPPDSVADIGALDTLRYSFADPSRNTSDSLAVRVMWDSANAPVARYPVRFRLENLADTVVARLVDDQGRVSTADRSGALSVDTTGADGVALRRIRLTPGATLSTPVDSIAIIAEVTLRGNPIAGSPRRFVLYVTPFSPP
jgi:hypothetical protein